MYGWRARIGLIAPSANTVNEPEFQAAVPDGVTVHSARMIHETASVDNQSTMVDKSLDPAAKLATADVDVIVFGCTTGSLVKGAGYEEEVEATISEAAGGIPAVATAASINRAFDALGVESLAVATPYPADLNDREAEYLEDSGYEVVTIDGLEIDSAEAKGDLTPEEAYEHGKAVDSPEADCVFISCTNYRTFGAIEALEADLGKPVVTSNQATLWDTLRTVGVDYSGVEHGALFDE